ncbi:NADPH-dependent F420 reductase [Ferruginibacter sp. SUN106]|uniref:NADPH-dependent F420 reductase n=1 Tax=Ferruginibacter sp. SUN106 TaxID=2978348 RepID=UPI003D35A417
MKIGIIGSGIVGRVLGSAFLKEGHEVVLGTRDTAKAEVVQWKTENAKAQTGSFADAAAFAEIIVLATSGSVTANAIELAGKENFAGKIVIDATNPIAAAPPVNGVLQFSTNQNDSLLQQTQKLLPEAKLVKAFNSVGNAVMYKPDYGSIKPSMFICGNDDAAKKTVTDILTSFGWETEDMGKAEAAGAIESLCVLWCIPGFKNNEWTHAFKLLRK